MYSRLSCTQRQAPPVTMRDAFSALAGSAFLTALGCRRLDTAARCVLLLANVPGVSNGAALTDSRVLYERGSPEIHAELHFAAWGEPVFEAVLAAVLACDTPRCMRRIEAAVPGSNATLIGYAVATTHGVRLVKSIAELSGLSLDANAELGDEHVAPLRGELEALAREEGRSCTAADWVETINEEAGRTEEAMHCFAAARLLEYIATDQDMLFRPALAALQNQLAEHEVVRIAHVPANLVRAQRQLLFDLSASSKAPTTSTSICRASCSRFCTIRRGAPRRRCASAASISRSGR